jgi:hypothetical protein
MSEYLQFGRWIDLPLLCDDKHINILLCVDERNMTCMCKRGWRRREKEPIPPTMIYFD